MDIEVRCGIISRIEEDDHAFVLHLKDVVNFSHLLEQIGRKRLLGEVAYLDSRSNMQCPDEWLKS